MAGGHIPQAERMAVTVSNRTSRLQIAVYDNLTSSHLEDPFSSTAGMGGIQLIFGLRSMNLISIERLYVSELEEEGQCKRESMLL